MNTAPLWSWMTERYAIYVRRASGQPWPWTADPILQTYRFCNIFRELDRTTVWIRQHIREPYAKDPDLWFLLCIARVINHTEVLEDILGDPGGAWPAHGRWRPASFEALLDRRRAAGLRMHTGAYMVRADGVPGSSKAYYLAHVVLGGLWKVRLEIARWWGEQQRSIQECTEMLSEFYGWGGFMAYEVATDLRHTHYLRDASDVLTWANPGPGAVRGLNRLAGRPVRAAMRPGAAVTEMRVYLEAAPAYLPADFPALELRDIEHSLCEVDKYERVRLGEGQPRAHWRAGASAALGS
jgi:hypothetical protein